MQMLCRSGETESLQFQAGVLAKLLALLLSYPLMRGKSLVQARLKRVSRNASFKKRRFGDRGPRLTQSTTSILPDPVILARGLGGCLVSPMAPGDRPVFPYTWEVLKPHGGLVGLQVGRPIPN